ncbi:MAG: NAD(P)/FAD-dependent oxidoreductase [Streptococcaceae bacterium]|nr:NAD(P)/FAD-dependent oxidoreductase [Streptococcaceae bacterium]
MKKFDVIVVGAGPSGMMAAIAAAENGVKVALIDKNKNVGKKLLLTGGGRCNVTNSASVEEILSNVPGNGRFLYSAFSQFDNQDIIRFFETNGVKLKEEDHGRIFPVSDKSKTIVDALFQKILSLHISVFSQSTVESLIIEEKQIKGLKVNGENFQSKAVILSTGGKAYPSTGSTGDGYQFAKSAGHTITKLFATESSLISDEKFIAKKELMGISLRDIKLSVLNQKSKIVISHQHDLLFTHFGLSGPAALRSSTFVNQELLKGAKSVTVSLDQFPDKSAEQLKQEISQLVKSDKSIKNLLTSISQERMAIFALKYCQISESKSGRQISEKDIEQIVDFYKNFQININKTFPIEKSFVTAGGVSLKEINPKTLESKLCKGLFMTGELLDINGYTGGYNITCAFVTGHVAGSHSTSESV